MTTPAPDTCLPVRVCTDRDCNHVQEVVFQTPTTPTTDEDNT